MAITVNDIKLLESERLADTPDGGGRMTGSVVDNAQVNNLFPDISRLDRTYGRLGLRKAYMAVQSLNTDVYLGAHVIITDPPADDKVSVTLFTTESPVDVRDDAQNRIESYITSGPFAPYYLFGNQPQGAKAITLLGREETALPEVGEVYLLSVEDASAVVTSQQYLRIAAVDYLIRTFTDETGEYKRKVVTLTLTSELRQTFIGAEASRFSNVSPPTKVRTTTVADASRYFGISRLTDSVLQNALEVKIDSIFSQLVPSTTREVGVAGAKPGLTLNYVKIGAERVSDTVSTSPAFLHRGIYPGSMKAARTSVFSGGKDDGQGNLMNSANIDSGDVDYEAGKISPLSGIFYDATYTPACTVQRSSYSCGVEIQLANQGTVYVQALPVPPAPKTVRVDYRFLGKWYTLTDKAGDGLLVGGSPSEGGGTIDYVNGNVTVTLGALPDIGSQVIFSVGQNIDFTMRAGTVTPTSPKVEFNLTDPVESTVPVTFTWVSGGVTKNAAVAAGSTTITGDATGSLIAVDGFVSFLPNSNAWPDSNSTLVVSYTKSNFSKGNLQGTATGTGVTWTYPAAALPIKPGTMLALVPTVWFDDDTFDLWVMDDGAGNIISANPRYSYRGGGGVQAGTINYSTGVVNIDFASMTGRTAKILGYSNPGHYPKYAYQNITSTPISPPNPTIQYWTSKATAGTNAVNESVLFPGISLGLSLTFTDQIVPGSVWFSWGGKEYFDRQGKLFRDLNRTTGAATQAGTIDYQTGRVVITNWGTTTGGAVTLRTLLTSQGLLPVSELLFRLPGSPIRPGSFFIQAVRSDTGSLISATSTINGPIANSVAEGFCDHQMGWVNIRFGEYVTAAGNENETWYDEANVVGSNVFKPIPVDPSTVSFNCVVLSTLPLDAELLGIDPVRLPLTGQVPIFREGNVIVIHEERSYTFPTVAAGQTVTLPDSPVTQLYLEGSNGEIVDLAQYTVDNQAGTVTMANPMNLGTVTQPLTSHHVVEDMILVSGVELSGRLTLVSPVSRDYPAGTLVSSALLFGDLQAQNPFFFSQQTWTGIWSDARIGSNTTAQFNRTLYPLELINKNAVTERWALIFTNGSGGNIVGETLGVIGTFTISADCQPINPVTGQPYFILRNQGWGSGWATNNVLRFNTVGPNAPIWMARTVLPGAQALTDDSFKIQMRGDAD